MVVLVMPACLSATDGGSEPGAPADAAPLPTAPGPPAAAGPAAVAPLPSVELLPLVAPTPRPGPSRGEWSSLSAGVVDKPPDTVVPPALHPMASNVSPTPPAPGPRRTSPPRHRS